MKHERMTVKWIQTPGPEVVRIGLDCTGLYDGARPGQFVMVRVAGEMDPLLSRPFSIHDIQPEDGGDTLAILFKIVGKGTRRMARVKQGDGLDVLGPLGKGFDISGRLSSAFVVGGGIGVAPLNFLLTHMENSGIPRRAVTVFAGARSKEDLLCLDELSSKAAAAWITTDDGSFGQRGPVTDAVERALRAHRPEVMYACGPVGMLKSLARLAGDFGVPCQVSLETVMACGMGACLGCAVKNSKAENAYAHVCVDGPVFDLAEFGF